MLPTFGCLAWVHVPKMKRKKLDDPAIPAIFVGYNEEHKGWKFISPKHNPTVFWSNAAKFLENKSWDECTEVTLGYDMDPEYHMEDIEDIRYTEQDIHDEEQ